MTVDVAQPLAALTQALTAVLAVGLAVTLVLVAVKTWHWLRAPIDAEDGFEEVGHIDADELAEVWDEGAGGYYGECPECGCNSADDPEFVQASHSDTCGQCGATLDISEIS